MKTLEPIDILRYSALYFAAMTNAHMLNLSLAFCSRIDDVSQAMRMFVDVETETDLNRLKTILRTSVIDRLLTLLEGYEERILASLTRTEDCERFHAIVDEYDDAVADSATVLVIHIERRSGVVEDVTDALAQRGVTLVSAMTKRDLAERIRDRRRRRKWLRTPEGQAYLRERRRRERTSHHIDVERSRTAKQAHRLYKQ